MNILDTIETLSKFFNATKGDVKMESLQLVGGSAALLLGLRSETQDIDASLLSDEFDKLVKKHNLKPQVIEAIGDMPPVTLVEFMGVDLHRVDALIEDQVTMRVKWGHQQNEVVLQYLSMKALLAFRLKLNRPKDQAEIKLIQERLKAGKS